MRPSGEVYLQFFGTPGQSYTLQASTNLLDWTNMSRIVATEGSTDFVDTSARNVGQRFYRLAIGL